MDIVTYALLNKRIKSVMSGISNIKVDGTNLIFEFSDGASMTMTFPTPQDGVSVIDATIDENKHLILQLSNNTIIDAGLIPTTKGEDGKTPYIGANGNWWIGDKDTGISAGGSGGSSVLEADLKATTEIGMVTNGKVYTKGTRLEDIIRDILTTYQKCKLTVTHTPTTTLYDAVTDTLNKITIKADVVKGTENVTNVSFFIDGKSVKELTTGVADGGSFSYEHTFATPTNKTFVIKVTATDGKQEDIVTKTVVFIGKTYYGTVGEEVVSPTETDIKNLQYNTLKNSKKFVYQHITVDYGKVLYAYPASLGKLTKIVDADGRDYTNSYTQSETTVDGIRYYTYLLTDAMGTDDGYQSFV